MKLDCYAVLGLSPTAEDVVIRAAYLALMRNYHPDRNGSAEAAARARAITEAYKMVGNPVRRAEYDASRRAHQFEILGYDDEMEPRLWRKPPAIRWPKAPVIGAAASALAIVLAVMVLPLIQNGREDTAPRRATELSADPEQMTREASASPLGTTEEKRPSELVAAVSSRTLETDPRSASTILPLRAKAPATRSKAALETAPKPVPEKIDVPTRARRIAAAASPTAVRAAPPKPGPINEKARVATLESMATSFYNQSITHADEARRSQLQQARDLFVNARDACRSDSCVGDAHASYIRDISRIMKPKQTDP